MTDEDRYLMSSGMEIEESEEPDEDEYREVQRLKYENDEY